MRRSVGMRRRGGPPVLLAALLAIFLVSATPVAAAISRGEVFSALGLDDVPADYIVVVDTSRSMQQGTRYQKAKSAIGMLLRSVSRKDHLSLITFDATPALRYTGPVGAGGGRRALAQLPASARGGGTDIGAALDAALSELERPNASDIGTVVLLTDGKHNPPGGSAYPTTTGAAWNGLGRRGRGLGRDSVISAYALGLRAGSDAALLKRAFSGATVVALPPGQLPSFLGRVKEQTRIAKARQLVRRDAGKAVRVAWPRKQLAELDLTQGKETVGLRLRSRLRHVPLTLRDLGVQAAGLPIRVSGLPDGVALRPGQTKVVPVQLSFEKRGGFRIGKKTVTESGALTLTGTVGTPWREILQRDLKTKLKPRLVGAESPTRATGKVGWGLLGLLVLLVLLGLIVAAVAWLWVNRNPKLRGSLTASGGSEGTKSVELAGRVIPIGKAKKSRLPIEGRGSVRGRRVKKRTTRGKDVELEIAYAKVGQPKRARCRLNSSAVIDGITFAYRL